MCVKYLRGEPWRWVGERAPPIPGPFDQLLRNKAVGRVVHLPALGKILGNSCGRASPSPRPAGEGQGEGRRRPKANAGQGRAGDPFVWPPAPSDTRTRPLDPSTRSGLGVDGSGTRMFHLSWVRPTPSFMLRTCLPSCQGEGDGGRRSLRSTRGSRRRLPVAARSCSRWRFFAPARDRPQLRSTLDSTDSRSTTAPFPLGWG